MKAYVIPAGNTHVDTVRRVDLPEPPPPAKRQVLVEIGAASMNYRDLLAAAGDWHFGPVKRDTIPASDAAGTVVAVGEAVTGLKVGDRVVGLFTQPPVDGSAGPHLPLGFPLDGVLAERVLFQETGLLKIPAGLSFAEAACLPCAGATAWEALFGRGRPVKPGDTVLILGTGGVSMLAFQFAKLAGARVIATSSSDEKLDRLRAWGADGVVNYRATPEWQHEVMRLTDGAGADCIVEVGGAGTLQRSLHSVARHGKIALIGVLDNGGQADTHELMVRQADIHGIIVGGPDTYLRDLLRAVEVNAMRPRIARTFEFDDAHSAYRTQASGDFMGKLVIDF